MRGAFKKTIYKKDSKGKIRQLTVESLDDHVIQVSGLVDGKLTRKGSKCHPKNIGKSNATTGEEQAVLEAAAKIEDKMTIGYFDTILEAETTVVWLPMLAESYKDHKDKIVYPCVGQPKLDGMRANKGNHMPMLSRKGKPIPTMGHIEAEIDNCPYADRFDGELYAHGKNFQENMRLIKKDRGPETQEVMYHVYDVMLPNLPFMERYTLLKMMVDGLKTVEIVPIEILNNEEELKAYHIKNLANGFEGTMVRWGEEGYTLNKRDNQLLKYKDFLDKTYKVVDVLPSDKDPEQGVVHCINDAGQTFGCGMKFTHKERAKILADKDKYIGQPAEIRFFEYSESGIPRFPVCHGFRLDK